MGTGNANEPSAGLGVGEGLGTTFIGSGDDLVVGIVLTVTTPVFQIKTFPDLMHVNFLPEKVDVSPAFAHFDPATTAA